MQYFTNKRVIIALAFISIIIIALIVRNNSTFNQEKVKKESRSELENFLKISDNKIFIANNNEIKEITKFIDNKCKKYFTADFINDTKNVLSTKSFGNTFEIFYLCSKSGKVSFYNNYNIYSPTVDKENETVTYKLEANDIVYIPTTYVYIQMKSENGSWKINKTLQ